MKIHLFCSDLLSGAHSSISSAGMRSLQYLLSLRSDPSTQLSYSLPRIVPSGVSQESTTAITPLRANYISLDQPPLIHDNSNQIEILEAFNPDIAIWLSLDDFNLPEYYSTPCRLVADLQQPFVSLSTPVTDKKNKSNAAKTTSKLSRLDSLVTSSERQRYYWLGQCLAAGIPEQDLQLKTIPFTLPLNLDQRVLSSEPSFLYVYSPCSSQNMNIQLQVFAETLAKFEIGKLHIHLCSDFATSSTNASEFDQELQALKHLPCVEVHNDSSPEDVREAYKSTWCALDLTNRNSAQEIGMSYQAIDFLRNGVPIVHNSFSSLSEDLNKINAGWCVEAGNLTELRDLTETLLDTPRSEFEELSNLALELCRNYYSYEDAVKEINSLCVHKEKRSDLLASRSLAPISVNSRSRVLILSEKISKSSVQRTIDAMSSLCRQGLIAGYTLADTKVVSGPHFFENYDIIIAHGELGKDKTSSLLQSKTPFVRDIYPSKTFIDHCQLNIASEIALAEKATVVIHPSEDSKRWYDERFSTSSKDSIVIPDGGKASSRELPQHTPYSGILLFGSDLARIGRLEKPFCNLLRESSKEYSVPLYVVDESGESNGNCVQKLLPNARYSADVNRWQLYFYLASQPRLLCLLPETEDLVADSSTDSAGYLLAKQTQFEEKRRVLREHGCSIIFANVLDMLSELPASEWRVSNNLSDWQEQIARSFSGELPARPVAKNASLDELSAGSWHPAIRKATRFNPVPYQTFTFADHSQLEKIAGLN